MGAHYKTDAEFFDDVRNITKRLILLQGDEQLVGITVLPSANIEAEKHKNSLM